MISDTNQAKPLDKTAVMPSVISNDDLKLAHEKLQETLEPIQAELDIAKEKYNNGEYVLEPGNLLEKRIAVLNGKNCEWIEF